MNMKILREGAAREVLADGEEAKPTECGAVGVPMTTQYHPGGFRQDA